MARGREGTTRREIRSALDGGAGVEDLREAILQTYLFAGFPRAINGLWVLDEEAELRITNYESRDRNRARRDGETLCRRIYGRDYEPMMRKMRRLSPDLAEWILIEGYGKVLSRPRFTARERELMVVPALAAMEAWRQLPSHVQGARNVGATQGDLRRIVDAVRDLLSGAVYGKLTALLMTAPRRRD